MDLNEIAIIMYNHQNYLHMKTIIKELEPYMENRRMKKEEVVEEIAPKYEERKKKLLDMGFGTTNANEKALEYAKELHDLEMDIYDSRYPEYAKKRKLIYGN